MGYFTLEHKYLDIKLYYLEEKLRLVDNKNITNFYLSKINNTPILEILEFIEETFPIENESGKGIYFEDYSRNIDVLEYLGIDIKNDIKLTFVDINDGKKSKLLTQSLKKNNLKYMQIVCSVV